MTADSTDRQFWGKMTAIEPLLASIHRNMPKLKFVVVFLPSTFVGFC